MQLKDNTQRTEERKNRMNGESIMLTKEEARRHDNIFINELAATLDRTPNQYGWTPNGSDVYFCSQRCKFDWLSLNMENIEHGRPIEFIRHRRETQGYAKVKNDDRWGPEYRIERVDNGQIVE